MNDALVSRKALIEYLDNQLLEVSEQKQNGIFTEDVLMEMRTIGKVIRGYVTDMTIAYDVDKVVEKLDKEAQMLYSIHSFEPVKAWKYENLIPIVKEGGV